MKEAKITVLMVEPGKHPRETALDNNLDALQKAVSIGAESQGLIEIVDVEQGVCILCNEEAKLIGLEGNRRFGDDILTGVFYVTGSTEDGELATLPPEAMEKYRKRFWEPETYTAEDVENALTVCFYVL